MAGVAYMLSWVLVGGTWRKNVYQLALLGDTWVRLTVFPRFEARTQMSQLLECSVWCSICYTKHGWCSSAVLFLSAAIASPYHVLLLHCSPQYLTQAQHLAQCATTSDL
jgi:hypothetical protein